MHPMRSARRVTLALATAALLAAPSTAPASSKLFRVSLSGRDTTDVTRSFAVPPDSERCTGTITDTRHLTSSFGVKPVRSRAVTPNRSFGWVDFKHVHEALRCHWWRQAKTRRGMLECQRRENLQLIEEGPPRTKLTEAAVKRLGVGRRVTVSGTIVIPYHYDLDNPDINGHRRGQERLKYTLTVRRVR